VIVSAVYGTNMEQEQWSRTVFVLFSLV